MRFKGGIRMSCHECCRYSAFVVPRLYNENTYITGYCYKNGGKGYAVFNPCSSCKAFKGNNLIKKDELQEYQLKLF